MKSGMLILHLLLSYVLVSATFYPVGEIAVNQAGLNEVQRALIVGLSDNIQGLAFPDQSGESTGLKWKISKIFVKNFEINEKGAEHEMLPGDAIRLTIRNVHAVITARADATVGFGYITFNTGTDVEATAMNSHLSASVTFSSTGDTVELSLHSCGADITNFEMHFYGSIIGSVANLFRSQIANTVKEIVRPLICVELRKAFFPEMNRKIANLVKNHNFQNTLQKLKIEYALQQPVIYHEGIGIGIKLKSNNEVLSLNHSREIANRHDQMLCMALDEKKIELQTLMQQLIEKSEGDGFRKDGIQIRLSQPSFGTSAQRHAGCCIDFTLHIGKL